MLSACMTIDNLVEEKNFLSGRAPHAVGNDLFESEYVYRAIVTDNFDIKYAVCYMQHIELNCLYFYHKRSFSLKKLLLLHLCKKNLLLNVLGEKCLAVP